MRAGIPLNTHAGRDVAAAFRHWSTLWLDLSRIPARFASGAGASPPLFTCLWADLSQLGLRMNNGSPCTPAIGLGANALKWAACGRALAPARYAAGSPTP